MMDYLTYLFNKLPRKPYCANDLRAGLKIRPLKTALKFRYIQFNHLIINSLIFDVDRPGAALAWEDGNVATPNIVVVNNKNQHSHLIYFLARGVTKFPTSSLKALKYLAAVEYAYTTRLKADAGYSGLIAKNPLSSFWLTWNIHERLYDLSELADYVDLKAVSEKEQKEQIRSGVGRNVDLFENGRKWAYEAVRDFRHKTYNDFFSAVFSNLKGLNGMFLSPLQANEVISTAKSIARWTWRRDGAAHSEFLARQDYKRSKGHIISCKRSESRKAEAGGLKNAGFSNAGIARALGISRCQVYRYFNIT